MNGPRFALALAAFLSAAPAVSTPSAAEDYPARPIRIVVPFGAGGPADVTARLIGNVLQEGFGQPFVVHPSVPAKTLQEFIALAKSQPGKLNYASSGQGTPYHMAGELFKTMAGIDVVHVPYRNSGEARSGVIGGQVQMMIDAVPTMAPNIGEKQVRALATTGKARSSVLPDVPTAIEAGIA